MTTREPEWDDAERDWMLALAQYEASLCPNCGRPISVCTDPANEMRWQAPMPTRCHATTAVLRQQENYAKAPHARGLLFHADLT
jgi:hypothetical protein